MDCVVETAADGSVAAGDLATIAQIERFASAILVPAEREENSPKRIRRCLDYFARDSSRG